MTSTHLSPYFEMEDSIMGRVTKMIPTRAFSSAPLNRNLSFSQKHPCVTLQELPSASTVR